MPTDEKVLKTLPPEKLLVSTRLRAIRAATRMLTEPQSLIPYITHERNTGGREGILRVLQERKNKLGKASGGTTESRIFEQNPIDRSRSHQLKIVHEEYEPTPVGSELAPDWDSL